MGELLGPAGCHQGSRMGGSTPDGVLMGLGDVQGLGLGASQHSQAGCPLVLGDNNQL